jgi:hypothetical protein
MLIDSLTEITVWDDRLLAEQLRELSDFDLSFDIETTGFKVAEIDLRIASLSEAGATAADEAPLPVVSGPPISRLGDLWSLGRHRLLCADAINPAAYSVLMGSEEAAIAFSDPPYNVPVDGHVSGLGALRHREFPVAVGEMTAEAFTGFLHSVFGSIARHSRPPQRRPQLRFDRRRDARRTSRRQRKWAAQTHHQVRGCNQAARQSRGGRRSALHSNADRPRSGGRSQARTGRTDRGVASRRKCSSRAPTPSSGAGVMVELSPAEYRAVCRQDLYTFTTRCFAELLAGTTFLPNWHMEVIAAKLQACMEGKIKRLIINLPPRHLKSLMASIALPAFWLGHHPNASIVNVTYGQALSDKFARDCRIVMASPWYRSLFATRFIKPRAALQELTTTAGGSRFATSVNGVLTGRGADVIIIDDPLNGKRRSETGPQIRPGSRANPLLNGRRDSFRLRKPLTSRRFHETRRKSPPRRNAWLTTQSLANQSGVEIPC